MTTETPALPKLRDLWDFGDPVATRGAFTDLLESEAVQADPTYRLQLLTQIARTFSLKGAFEEAHRVLDEVEAAPGFTVAVVRVRYLLERGRTFNSAREVERARPLFVEAWELARASGLDALAVDAAHMMGIVEPDAEALRWTESAMELAETSDDPDARAWLGSLYNNLGWTYHDQGASEQALEVFQKGLAWRQRRDDPGPTRIAKWSVGRALRALGRVEEAVALQLELEREWTELGESDGFVYEELGELHLSLNKTAEAKAYFRKAYPLLKDHDWLEEHRIARMKELAGD